MDQPGPPSVLLLEVPAAEPVVAPLRERLDSSAALGIPAHVTVLYPFVPAGQIGPELLARLAALFRGVAGFGFRLGRPLAGLREAERAVQPSLPVKARATSVGLYARPAEGAPWARRATFSLA
jgi:hypothetical protein